MPTRITIPPVKPGRPQPQPPWWPVFVLFFAVYAAGVTLLWLGRVFGV